MTETNKAADAAKDTASSETKGVTTSKSGVHVEANRENYTTCRSASGSKSMHNGDPVAAACEGLNIDEMTDLASSFIGQDYKGRYANLNVGMQRMNLGNRIRGHISKIDKANAAAVAALKEGEKAPAQVSGVDQFAKAVAPFAKKRDDRVAAEEAEKVAKAKKAEAAAAAKKKAAEKPAAKAGEKAA